MYLEDVPTLRTYLTTQLTVLSDADPAALADYIIALLKHEKPPVELKAFCTSQLLDFLHDGTENFVEGLFKRIENGPAVVEEGGEEEEEEEEGNVSMKFAPVDAKSSSILTQSQPPLITSGTSSNIMREDDRRTIRDSRSFSDEEERGEYSSYRPRREHERHRSRSPGRNDDRRPYNRRYDRYDGRRGGAPPIMSLPPPPFGFPPSMPLPSSMGGGGGGVTERGMRIPRSYSARNAPPQQRSQTRLVIDRIPPDFCAIAAVNEYFQRFGTIVNITVQPELQRARIEYSTHEQAKAAYSSPEVIFENRFVKVFWDHEELPTPSLVRSMPNNRSMSASSTPVLASTMTTVPSRVEALQKKQQAVKGMLELQKQKQELVFKYIAQQKELLGKLENKSLSENEKQEVLKTLRSIDDLIKSLNININNLSINDVTLELKAAVLSSKIPNSSNSSLSPPPNAPTTGPVLRGGPNMRGRGSGGNMTLKGGTRGGGAGGSALAGRAAHRLDLRPTAFMMRPIPSRVGRNIGSIRKLFEPYGEIKNITLIEDESSGAIISFVRRTDAEKAVFYIPKTDLGEPFSLDWVAAASTKTLAGGPVSSSPSLDSQAITTTKAVAMETDSIAMEGEGEGGESVGELEEDNGDNDNEAREKSPGSKVDSPADDHIPFEEGNDDSHWKR